MFNTTSTGVVPSLSDIAAVTGNNSNDSMWGNGAWWIVLIVLLFAGFGNGGYGNFGGGNAGAVPYMMANTTDSEVSRGFDTLALSTKLDAIGSNVTDGFYGQNTAILQGFGNLNTSLCSSFDSVNSNLANLGYNLQNNTAQLNYVADSIKYENAKNTAEIISASTANTQRIVDQMVSDKMQDLRDQLSDANFKLNQQEQTAAIISTLLPTPRPAYTVASPYQSQTMGYYGCSCGA